MRQKTQLRTEYWLFAYLVALLGATFWPYNFFATNNVSWETTGGIRFSEPAIAYSKPFVSGLDRITDFTLLMHFSAEVPGQSSWILSHGLDFEEKNILVGLYVDQLVVEITRGGRNMRAILKDVLENGKPVWVGVVFGGGDLSVYLDGELKKTVRGRVQDSTWHAEYPLVLGARADGKYPWSGALYRFALVDFPATPSQLANPERFLSASDPVLDYRFDGNGNRSVANHGSIESGPIVIPESFQPFRRATPLSVEELWNPPPIWSDVILNILGFIPLGFILAALLRRKVGSLSTLFVVLGVSLMFSLGIEFLQAFVPRRWSTFTDVITNGAGGLLGAVLLISVWGRGLVHRLGFIPRDGDVAGVQRQAIPED